MKVLCYTLVLNVKSWCGYEWNIPMFGLSRCRQTVHVECIGACTVVQSGHQAVHGTRVMLTVAGTAYFI